MIQPTRLDMERAEAEKLQERTDYMLNAALLQLKLYKKRLEKCEAALRKARVLLISEGDPDEDGEMIAEIDELLGDAARAAVEEPKLSSEVIMVTDPLYDPWRGEK